jgi:hypothetical protein
MRLIEAGAFWVGSEGASGNSDEQPRFRSEVASFCMDETEVTVTAYLECVDKSACKPAHERQPSCNIRGGRPRQDRDQHPVNCVDWYQANAYCAFRGARLPSEVEWEYAARGGDEYLKYPWGQAHPDGKTCWKTNSTCKVKTFAAGAFGLYDISGNLWEWTDTWYGRYPWPPRQGFAKVYRGGSWSRRFEKWMQTGLRNRQAPKEWGSHLGFRCALTPESTRCPFGRTQNGKACLHGVVELSCPPDRPFNGVRCAAPGEPRCRPGHEEHPGFGCLAPGAPLKTGPEAVDRDEVSRIRSPEFDSDCRANMPGRPRAFRYMGGNHKGRNAVSGEHGCKNRDVGVGWNSTCCP